MLVCVIGLSCSEAVRVPASQLCETIEMTVQEFMEIKGAILRVQ